MNDLLLGMLANSISELADEFQALADTESKAAGAYGLMKASAANHSSKSEAYDVCAAKARALLTKIKGG